MRIKTLLVATALAIVSIVPLGAPAQATHNCGFDPCPHPEDVFVILCWKPVTAKYLPICNS